MDTAPSNVVSLTASSDLAGEAGLDCTGTSLLNQNSYKAFSLFSTWTALDCNLPPIEASISCGGAFATTFKVSSAARDRAANSSNTTKKIETGLRPRLRVFIRDYGVGPRTLGFTAD